MPQPMNRLMPDKFTRNNMTSHQLAKQLLCEPDLPITIEQDRETGELFNIGFSIIFDENNTEVIVLHRQDSNV